MMSQSSSKWVVEEVLGVVGQAPLGHDRAAAGDDAGDALGGHRHVAQAHAGVHGEVVDALLALLDDGVAEDLPGQVFGDAVHLFQGLVDGHGADGHGAVADDPLAGVVDVFAGGEVHQGVAAPADRPHHFFDLFGDGGGHRRVADIGVDLHQEIAADDHRLQLGVVDIAGDDGAAAGDFLADKFRGDLLGDVRAKGFALGDLVGDFARLRFSRMATYSISGVMMPWRA